MMRFAEEILLLLLNESTGQLEPVPEWKMACVLSGAVLMDLALENRIDTDLQSLMVTDAKDTGDPMLDPVLADISAAKEVHNARYWVERTALRAESIREIAFERLVNIEILDFDTGGYWTLSRKVVRSGRYPFFDGRAGAEIKGRILRTLLDEEIPDPREIVIISLVNACDGFKNLLTDEEMTIAHERIKTICKLDLIGQSIIAAIRESHEPPRPTHVIPQPLLPRVSTMDLFLSSTWRSGNLPKFFAEKFEELGPVFELKSLGRKSVVLAGLEMNRWANNHGCQYLRSHGYTRHDYTGIDYKRFMEDMDGANHLRLRKALRSVSSRSVVEARLKDVVDIGRRYISAWPVGIPMKGNDMIQPLVGMQMGILSAGVDPTPWLADIRKLEESTQIVPFIHVLPRLQMISPRLGRIRRRIHDLYVLIHGTHTPEQRRGQPRDFIDEILNLHYNDKQLMPESELFSAFLLPFFSGTSLGSAILFALYELLKHPDLKEHIFAEADRIFKNREPSAEDFRAHNIDVTHRFVMESLRLYPVVPFQIRTVINTLQFDGYKIPPGTEILIAHPATHYLDTSFKEPMKFDIDRYSSPRKEQTPPGAYQPFGIGTHSCLGAHWSELHMAANLLLVLHHLDLELDPKDHKLKISAVPKLTPHKSLRISVTRLRHEFN